MVAPLFKSRGKTIKRLKKGDHLDGRGRGEGGKGEK